MTSYCGENEATTHYSRHYESCLNSNCSRSPSPVHRQLWEPKHPPPQKLKNNKNLPFKQANTTKQGNNHTKNRDRSPFLCSREYNIGGTTSNTSHDPLFTYTINEGPIDNKNGTKDVEVKIQRHLDYNFSLPSLGSEAPEPCRSSPPNKDQKPAGNVKLELELDTSRVPPIVTIKNNTTKPNTKQKIQLGSSTPLATSAKSCPSPFFPRVEEKSSCLCNCCNHPQPCLTQETTETCDVMCQPCPYLSSPQSNPKEDKATSPTKPCCTSSPCNSTCCDYPKCCLCLRLCPNGKEDRGISPICPCSRSASHCSLENTSPNPNHGFSSYNSDISSQGTIDIKINEATKVDVDWEGDVGPINIDFSAPRKRGKFQDDQVHSHDPQLEAFYTSSYNQSRSVSPSRNRSSSPSPPPSARQNSRPKLMNPPWNSCQRVNHDCFNETHLATISTSRSPCSPSTSCSRSPKSKTLCKEGLSQSSSYSSLDIYTNEDERILSNLHWSHPRPSLDTRSQVSKPERLDCMTEEQQLNTCNQLSSPILTLTPHTRGNGQMRIEWDDPRSCQEKRCKEHDSLTLKDKSPKGNYKDFQPSGYQDEVGKEEKKFKPQITVQVHSNPTSPNSNLGCKPCMQSIDSACSSSCKPSLSLTTCITPCDGPCQENNSCCNSSCCLNKNCMAPVEGVNVCPYLPPHLQSDWSASLRCPPSQVRSKPILFRDMKGHEYIMFADGSIEHLSQHCEPKIPIPPQPSQPPPFEVSCMSCPMSPPSPCKHLFNHEGEKFDRQLANNFSPKSGDIIIRAHQRLPCMYPGKDNGQVAFFTSDYLDLHEGDSIVRLGKFDSSNRWSSSHVVEMYLRGSHGKWMFLGTSEGKSALPPLEADHHQIVRTPNKQLHLRLGDLVISSFPRPNSFYFWNPKMKLDCDHSDLLLRAYIGQPQVVDENHNLACCVDGHLPVGYVELYVKVKRLWVFLGRDDHMFSEHELTYFS